MVERTPSQIGKSNRRRGNETQNAWAKAIRPWWARAQSNRNSGSASTADEGDITGTGPLIFWSVKYDQRAHQDGRRHSWMTEMREKAGPGRLPILVERRPLIGDPLRWFVHLWLDDYLVHVLGIEPTYHAAANVPIRLYGYDLMVMLALRGLTDSTEADYLAARMAREDANESGVAAELYGTAASGAVEWVELS